MRHTEDGVIGTPQAEASPGASMGKAAVRGVFWVGAGQTIKQFIAIATSILLARLLAPSDFGVFAMIFFAMGLAQVFTDFGLGSAIIQRRVADSMTLSTCFWLNMGIAIIAGAALVAAGPFLASFFEQPILAMLAFAGALNVLLACSMVVPQALLSQRFEFRKQTQAQLVGSLVGAGTAVFAAFSGAGVWSLIVQPLAGTSVTLVLMFRASHWRPRREFDYASVKAIVRFGAHLLGSNVVQTLGRNLHNIILGKWLGPGPLGTYNMAHQVTYFPIYQVSAVVVKVLFPTLVSLDDDPHRLRAAYKRVVAAIALVTFPCMAGLFAVADDFVLVVLGAQWLSMVPVLKVVCWIVMFQSVATTATTVLLSKGHSQIMFRLSIVSMVLTAIGLLLGSQWGLLGTAFGWGAAAFISNALLTNISIQKIGISPREFLAVLRGPFVAALGMCIIVLASITQMHMQTSGVRLTAAIALGLMAYTLLTYFFNRHESQVVLKLLHATWTKRREQSQIF